LPVYAFAAAAAAAAAVYEKCVRHNHESGNLLERKIRHLKSMKLFDGWSTSDVTFLAYSLQQKKLKDVRASCRSRWPCPQLTFAHDHNPE